MSTRFALTFATALALALASGAASAGNGTVVVDENGSDRINFANRLGMLAERIPAAACAKAMGIATEQAGPILAIASSNFVRVLDALEKGNRGMNIVAPEGDRRILQDISTLRTAWAPVATKAAALSSQQVRPTEAMDMVAAAPALRDRAERLTSRISGEYADPAQLLQRDALTLEIAGRQRILSQSIAKEACQLAGDPANGQARATLAQDIRMYSASLAALRNGMPELGISTPPNARIRDGLAEIDGHWTQVTPVLTRLAAGVPLSEAENALVYTEMNRVLGLMNTLVTLYSKASKQEL
ncbi:MAG: type IV pili methyl-accepting chemotaxis transducer N-terminal domain-containing protein [Pseudomonadota bacterium]